jgi:hypothetical protein
MEHARVAAEHGKDLLLTRMAQMKLMKRMAAVRAMTRMIAAAAMAVLRLEIHSFLA